MDHGKTRMRPALGALITALHRCQQRQLPVTVVGAGFPQLVGNTGKAKSYAERLFDFAEIGKLDGDIADIMDRKVTSVAPLRSTLTSKGMVYSPEHGDTAFTVRLFDEFVKRTMPEFGLQPAELITRSGR